MNYIIIPVIDLLNGQVVHARGGRRREYAPVRSPLCPLSEPLAVLAALLGLHPFSVMYIADLGALLGGERHDFLVEKLRSEFQSITFWVDSGARRPAGNRPGIRTVIGTETGISVAALGALTASGADFILSLDFNQSGVMGNAEILARPDCWPRDVIIMNLPSVGAARGPAWPVVDDVMRRAANRNFYLAGGVRNADDLNESMAKGMQGALVATALHTGTLDLPQFRQAKKTPA